MTTDREFLYHEPCPKCSSSNNVAVYDDGYKTCFTDGCDFWSKGEGSTLQSGKVTSKSLIRDAEYRKLSARNIEKATCRKYGYQVGEVNDKLCHIANYRDEDGNIIAQKLRFEDKTFATLGDFKNVVLFGQHLFKSGGKMVVVTEGEIDALSMSQVEDNRWPVVSIPSGVSGAEKAIKKSISFLESFEQVIFMFDQDEVGKAAADKCAALLSPGKARIAQFSLKDPNEMLKKGLVKELINAKWQAKEYRPDGIVSAKEAIDLVLKHRNTTSDPYPWDSLNEKLQGLRKTEIVTFCAGSGVGKSTFVKETAKNLLDSGKRIGYIALEESIGETVLSFLGMYMDKRLQLSSEITDEELIENYHRYLGHENIHFYDHFGSLDSDNLMSRIRYLAKGLDCDYIILDHISIVVSGNEGKDERKEIDVLMTHLKSFAMEAGVGLIIVSHLKRPDGKPHEEGGKTSLAQLRGSGSIGHISNIVIGLERNQQAKDPNITKFRVLKNRFSGLTGEAGHVQYDLQTGRLNEVAPDFMDCDDSEEDEFDEGAA